MGLLSSEVFVRFEQSPCAWFGKFSQTVEEIGMQKSKSDQSIFYRNSNSGIILLVVYVDDIVITRIDSKGISYLESFLQSQFHTKDLRMLRYFLGIEVMRSKHMKSFDLKGNICLIYCLRLKRLGAKPCSSPMFPSVHLTKEGETFEDPERYSRLVGKLNYLTVTRLDIAHSINVVS